MSCVSDGFLIYICRNMLMQDILSIIPDLSICAAYSVDSEPIQCRSISQAGRNLNTSVLLDALETHAYRQVMCLGCLLEICILKV